jgi:hypothetical protein
VCTWRGPQALSSPGWLQYLRAARELAVRLRSSQSARPTRAHRTARVLSSRYRPTGARSHVFAFFFCVGGAGCFGLAGCFGWAGCAKGNDTIASVGVTANWLLPEDDTVAVASFGAYLSMSCEDVKRIVQRSRLGQLPPSRWQGERSVSERSASLNISRENLEPEAGLAFAVVASNRDCRAVAFGCVDVSLAPVLAEPNESIALEVALLRSESSPSMCHFGEQCLLGRCRAQGTLEGCGMQVIAQGNLEESGFPESEGEMVGPALSGPTRDGSVFLAYGLLERGDAPQNLFLTFAGLNPTYQTRETGALRRCFDSPALPLRALAFDDGVVVASHFVDCAAPTQSGVDLLRYDASGRRVEAAQFGPVPGRRKIAAQHSIIAHEKSLFLGYSLDQRPLIFAVDKRDDRLVASVTTPTQRSLGRPPLLLPTAAGMMVLDGPESGEGTGQVATWEFASPIRPNQKPRSLSADIALARTVFVSSGESVFAWTNGVNGASPSLFRLSERDVRVSVPEAVAGTVLASTAWVSTDKTVLAWLTQRSNSSSRKTDFALQVGELTGDRLTLVKEMSLPILAAAEAQLSVDLTRTDRELIVVWTTRQASGLQPRGGYLAFSCALP